MRLIVYSHDAFGLGNIRRMLAICHYIVQTDPEASILVVSGSPALHSLRLPRGIDYIKLPCLERDQAGVVSAKYLDTDVEEAVQLRSDLILSTIKNFRPDLVLVDKKPDGLQRELQATLAYLKTEQPQTKLVLLLRDILDRPEATIAQWQRHGYYDIIADWYDQVWVVGVPEIFDVCREYQFPAEVSQKTSFLGYIRRERGIKPRSVLRQDLDLAPDQKLVLVTPGGGADGYRLVKAYLDGLEGSSSSHRSVIISGSEMPSLQRTEIQQRVALLPQVDWLEFTDDLVGFIDAADVVVAMGGYNTIGEILSLQKRAVIVPRVQPVEEQWIRAERMAALGLFCTIHPDKLTPAHLMQQLQRELDAVDAVTPSRLDMNALPRIADRISRLVRPSSASAYLSAYPAIYPLPLAASGY
ncbi:MAG: glycosyltransferase [Pegethrix bostrychoides GSE-TBD4-15B]|jgi:predicted glycosyltransferase|uniref:Glycosyltransferase n=1 Tax=Pegethrix bostrychoides GSE-TBD4-15B TaxID=2839662 RepID=A0A951P8Z0_9CYAN|nr:glycosyltransferase [Pegethrix bostrychoides GSE-TBD4-15B]